VIERSGYSIQRFTLEDGRCPKCRSQIDGVWQ
jgi:hypothetical protein